MEKLYINLQEGISLVRTGVIEWICKIIISNTLGIIYIPLNIKPII